MEQPQRKSSRRRRGLREEEQGECRENKRGIRPFRMEAGDSCQKI
jgi:hypothetical protein